MDKGDAFFVGYLPVGAGLSRWLMGAAVGLVLLAAGVAVGVAAGQRDPGPAVWEDGAVVEMEGQLIERPYPMLRTIKDGAVLLVREGKHGAAEAIAGQDGRRLRVRGTVLRRDMRTVFELATGAAVEVLSDAAAGPWTDAGAATLDGEIVDIKCYNGAMKPGDGQTHKACAILCLRGGIPPMLVAAKPGGGEIDYLLAAPDGGPLTGERLEAILQSVGGRVRVSGRLWVRDDVRVLRLADTEGVRRF